MKILGCLVCVTLVACGGDESVDMSVNTDMSATNDLATSHDLASSSDLSTLNDLASPADLANVDLSTPPDLRPPPDLLGLDLLTAPDMVTPMFTLTIDNYIGWCDVTVNSGSVSSMSTETVMFPANASVNLHAQPNSIFVWGYWVDTDAPNTHITNMSTSITMTHDKTMHVCCPDSGSDCTF